MKRIKIRTGRLKSRGAKQRSWRLWLAGLVVVLGLSWTIGFHSPRPEGPWFPLRYVRIEGTLQYLDTAKLHDALSQATSSGYFSLDMAEVESAVRKFDWVDTVKVARVWPDTLVVSLTEHRPAARWGERALLNERGERFVPPSVEGFAAFPVIYGPAGMERHLYNLLKDLNKKLEHKNMHVAALDLSKRRAYSVRLNGALDIHFGRQDPLAALDRFLALAPHLGEDRLDQLQRVDLRYANGFALVWKPTTEPGTSSAVPDGAVLHHHEGAGSMAREI